LNKLNWFKFVMLRTDTHKERNNIKARAKD